MDARQKERPPALKDIVSEEIRVLMTRQRVKQVALAPALGMSQSSLSLRLNGQKAWDVDELEQIANYFEVPVAQLLGEEFPLRADNKPVELALPDGQLEFALYPVEPALALVS